METIVTNTYGRLPYREFDVMTMPADVPGLGIKAGESGQIQALRLRRNGGELVAVVRVPYSTGQTKCLMEVRVKPEAE